MLGTDFAGCRCCYSEFIRPTYEGLNHSHLGAALSFCGSVDLEIRGVGVFLGFRV